MVARRATFLGRFGAGVVDVTHDDAQTVAGLIECPAATTCTLLLISTRASRAVSSFCVAQGSAILQGTSQIVPFPVAMSVASLRAFT